MPTPNSTSFRLPTLSRQSTIFQSGTRWNTMIVQALLTAVAVVLLLLLVLAASLAFVPTPFGPFNLVGTPTTTSSSSSSTTSNSTITNSPTSSSGLSGTSLEYYVHVQPQAANLAGLLPPANSNKSASFGTMQLFAFNATDGEDMESSTAVGVMRGYTLQTGYVRGQSFLVEVEVLQYSNPKTGVNGTLSIQGIVLNAPSTLAVVGGTDHFKGARGTCSISQLTSSVYHHLIEFL